MKHDEFGQDLRIPVDMRMIQRLPGKADNPILALDALGCPLPVKVTYPDIWTAAVHLAGYSREAWGNAGKVDVIIRGKE